MPGPIHPDFDIASCTELRSLSLGSAHEVVDPEDAGEPHLSRIVAVLAQPQGGQINSIAISMFYPDMEAVFCESNKWDTIKDILVSPVRFPVLCEVKIRVFVRPPLPYTRNTMGKILKDQLHLKLAARGVVLRVDVREFGDRYVLPRSYHDA